MKNKFKNMSKLTIILIILLAIFTYTTITSYSIYKSERELYMTELDREPFSADIDYTLSQVKIHLLTSLETNSKILDGDRRDMYLSYMLYYRIIFLQNRAITFVFLILTILSWKFDKLKKK